MDKLKVLLILLVTAVAGLGMSAFLLALSLSPYTSPLGVFAQIVSQGLPPSLPYLFPLSTLLFLFTVLASMVGVIYFLVLPEMKNRYLPDPGPVGKEASAMVMRTLKPDEQKVVGVLKVHGGSYVQKFVTREAGLSRLKTHRVVASLSERGIVNVTKKGNSNEVTLAKWFLEGL